MYPRSRTVHVYYADNQVTIYKQEDMIDGKDVLPGFSVKVGDIFGVLDEE